MPEILSLKTLFDSKKSELEQELEGLALPKDNKKIQLIISEYLATLFDSEGEFRQSLTQSEDYILQGTLSLLSAQQEMSNAFLGQSIQFKTVASGPKEEQSEEEKESSNSFLDYLDNKVSAKQAGIGTAAGALIGKFAFGGWGAVFGAIAGTAVAVYMAGKESSKTETNKSNTSNIQAEIVNEPINVPMFIGVVERICDSVDNLIKTFRAQINRVVDKYESMDKPTIEKDYGFLLQSIQTLVGYKRAHTSEDEKYIKKLQERIEDLAECLENFDLTVEDYNGENDSLFESITSSDAREKKMICPAIVKNGVPVLKGKLFVPKE